MKKTVAIIAIAGLASVASAQELLIVDLSVTDQITITATGEAAANSVSGGAFTGFLMADFYNALNFSGVFGTLVSGDLAPAQNVSDLSPSLFRGSTDNGLNVWAYTVSGDSDFVAGSLAFTGSATWDLDPLAYADMISGNLSGDIYAPADTDDDIAAAVFIGTWNVIPAPSSLALLGLGGIVAGRRRR